MHDDDSGGVCRRGAAPVVLVRAQSDLYPRELAALGNRDVPAREQDTVRYKGFIHPR